MGDDNIFPDGFYLIIIVILLIASILIWSGGIIGIEELGSAICDQQKPVHTLEFDHYQDKIVYCKRIANETSYDGLKIRIGE